MPSATSKLEILIEAKAQGAVGPINEVEKSLSGLNKAAGTLASGMSGLLGAAGVAGFGALAVGIGSAVTEMAKGAAETERLAKAFDNLAKQAGTSGDAMLAALRKAAQGTISDSQLMLDANTAMMLGVADNADTMAKLMDVAAARGHAFGESTAKAFEDLTSGLGRMSPQILNNIGIVINAKETYDDYAKSIGITADQLTDQERMQALVNAAIKSSTDLVKANKEAGGDAASNFERMDAAITNAKDALGALFAPYIAVIAQNLADAVNTVTDSLSTSKLEGAQSSMHDLGVEITNLAKEYQNAKLETDVALLHPEMMDQAKQHVENVQKQLQAFGEQYNKAAMIAHAPLLDLAALQQGIVAFGEMAPAIQKAGAAAERSGTQLRQMGIDALAAADAFNVAMNLSRDIASSIGNAAAQSGALFGAKLGGDVGLQRQKDVTAELNAQKQTWLDMHYTQKQIDDVLLPAYIQNLNQADQATFKVATGTAKISDAAQEAQQAFDDLKGKVASVLSGALDTGTGVDPQKALEAMGFPREDAINENARRLADIAANGLKNQDWLGQFQQEVPDIWKMIRLAQNPQEEAARLLQDFQDGLLTSPIDKEKAKEIVRRQIMGDQNMADLANEIATELAQEMGVPLQEAMAATQKTLGGGGGMGTEAATQFADGASQALDATGGGGAAFVSKYVDQMRAQYSLLATAGTEAGKRWGDAFLAKVGDSVPPQLISLLTDLITPAVLSRLAQRGTLTGATP